MSQEILSHVARHHPGIVVLSAMVNGTRVYFSAEGGEPVHNFLSNIAQGDCAKNLLLVLNSDPNSVNATWYPFGNVAADIGLNIKYAISAVTDPTCVASMTAKCFAAFNAVAPCVVKAVLQTGVDVTKAAASSQTTGAGIGGAVAGVVVTAAVAAGLFFWKRRTAAESTKLLSQQQESYTNNGL
ncbi:MAG: hypothetical protein SFW07_08100 [Gammaproteobacteria bacterium]|nr:hypothetical protein [Gammaproteobacteria bacterium]